MIWTTDAEGSCVSVSSELLALTGRSLSHALGQGWIDVVHPDDRAVVRRIMSQACQRQSAFTMRYRLRCFDGSYIWVVSGAVASIGPPDHTFLGFLGSITEIVPSVNDDIEAFGQVGEFLPPPPHPTTNPHAAPELVADYLLLARASAVDADVLDVQATIDLALTLIAHHLMKANQRDNVPVH